MPSLSDIAKILNPQDPTIAGLLPIGTTIAGGLTNLAGVNTATGNLQKGVEGATKTVSDAGASLTGVQDKTLADQLAQFEPYTTAGGNAVRTLGEGIQSGDLTTPFKYDLTDLYQDPAYQFAQSEGARQNHAELGKLGLGYSGGAARSLDQYNTNLANSFYNQDYSRAEKTFRDNQATRLSALQNLTGTGLQAANASASDIGTRGAQAQQGTEWTAATIADLQTQLADAKATGDLGRAATISDTLAGISNQVTGNRSLADLMSQIPGLSTNTPGAQQGIQKISDLAVNQMGGDLARTPGWNPSSAVPGVAGEVGGAGAAAGAATAIPGGTAATAASAAPPVAGWTAPTGGGFGSAAVGFLTNPITIGVGAAIVGAIAWSRSQAHHEASTWVSKFQNPFDQKMAQIQSQWDALKQSGQATPEIAAQIQAGVQTAAAEYQKKLAEFEKGGSDERKVASQARATADKWYGPGFQGFISQFSA